MKFKETNYNAKLAAQNNLRGKTHYFDDDTLQYFKSRILSCDILASANDQLLLIIESLPMGSFNGTRKTRAVCFDVFGNVVYRPNDGFTTSKAAKNDFYKWYENYNHDEHMQAAKEYEIKLLMRKIEEVKNA